MRTARAIQGRFRITPNMQSIDELTREFALPGVLHFDQPYPGMPRASIITPACTAEFYLQGAHLTQWQPVGQEPALFLSSRSSFAPGKAIRGGIPVVFPWFGPAASSPVHTTKGAAQHGFARVWPWTLRFAALAGDEFHLTTTLDQTEGIRALGFTGFELALQVILGRALTLRLTVANTGELPFQFEDVLHAYLRVGDSREVSVEGLKGTRYLDKTENLIEKTQIDAALRFTGEVDRPYLNTPAPLVVSDPLLRRRLCVEKHGSQSTVPRNPGEALAAKMSDVAPGDWNRFLSIEPGNVSANAITIGPRETHTTEMQLRIEDL